MAKDYAKFVPPKPKSKLSKKKKKSGGRDYIFILFFIVFGCAALGFFLVEKNPGVFQKLAAIRHKAQASQVAAKARAPKAVIADNKQPPVQFDFYNELPNMQVTVPAEPQGATVAQTVKVVKAAPDSDSAISSTPDDTIPAAFPKPKELARMPSPVRSVPADVSAEPAPQSDEVEAAASQPPVMSEAAVSKPVTEAASPPSDQKNIFNPDELSNLLEAEKSSQQFIVQVGSFDSDSGARRLLSALTDVGFVARVVKQTQGRHTIYRVQQGPFQSMELAKAGQQQLLKRGITSFIRKTT